MRRLSDDPVHLLHEGDIRQEHRGAKKVGVEPAHACRNRRMDRLRKDLQSPKIRTHRNLWRPRFMHHVADAPPEHRPITRRPQVPDTDPHKPTSESACGDEITPERAAAAFIVTGRCHLLYAG